MKAYRHIALLFVTAWLVLLFLHSYFIFAPTDFKIGRDEDMHLFNSCKFFRNITKGKSSLSDYINDKIHHPPLLYLTSFPFHLLLNDPTQKAAQWAVLLAIFVAIATSLYLAKTLGSPDSAVFALIFFSIALVRYQEMGHFSPYVMACALVPLIIALAYRAQNFSRRGYTVLTFLAAAIACLYYYALPVYLLFFLAVPLVSGLIKRPRPTLLNLAIGGALFLVIASTYLIPMGLFDWLKSWLTPTIKGSSEPLVFTVKRAFATFARYSSSFFVRTPELIPIYALFLIGLFFERARKRAITIAAGTIFTLFMLSFLKIVTDVRVIPLFLLLFVFLLSLPIPAWITRVAVIASLFLSLPHMSNHLRDTKEGLQLCHRKNAIIWMLKLAESEPNTSISGNLSPSAIDRITCELNLKFDTEKSYLTYVWGETKILEQSEHIKYIYLTCLDNKECDWFDYQDMVAGFELSFPRNKAEMLAKKIMAAKGDYKKLVSLDYDPICVPKRTESILVKRLR